MQNSTEHEVTRALSFGERAVGITFNPGKNAQVEKIKKQFAINIDIINDMRNGTSDPEIKRMCSVAITELQSAQMWAVKAATWN